jgi:hypothetical protein
LVALTAYSCLDWLPPPGASERRVVVRGASGGTGSWIVQCEFTGDLPTTTTQNTFSSLMPLFHGTHKTSRENATDTPKVAKVAFDCHVTAVCSNKNAEYVKILGADEVIDYTTQDVLQTLTSTRASNQEYDLIVDCVGGTELLDSYVRPRYPSLPLLPYPLTHPAANTS